MSKKIISIILGVAAIAILIFAGVKIIQNKPQVDSFDSFDTSYTDIIEITTELDYSDINPDSVVAPSDINGNLPDKVIGNLDTAEVIIYEYADFACSHCAEMNTSVKKLVEAYDGKVAVVFRTYLLKGYPNNVEAAAAATAASMQGYWDKFKNLVFSDQATWFYKSGSKAVSYFGELFVEASDGKGDLEKFYQDMASDAVAKRLAFDYAMGTAIDLTGTPTFRINGEKVSPPDLQGKIDSLLNN